MNWDVAISYDIFHIIGYEQLYALREDNAGNMSSI